MALVFDPLLERPGMPAVSVCIANYQGEQLLAGCLDSVLAQEGDFTIEVIVHDDASSDSSVALLHERYPQVQLIPSAHNVGFCVANNRMVARSSGEFVLLLNNDAELEPDAICKLVAAALAQPGPAILTLPQRDMETGALVDRGCLLDPFFNPVPNLDPRREDVAYVIGACLWVPRTEWERLGGFPEWMESIGEDLYLCSLARLRGIPVRVLQDSGYRHRQGASFGGNRPEGGRLRTTTRRRRLSERNKTLAMAILTPTLIAWVLLALHLALLLLEGACVAVAKREPRVLADVYLAAITDAWRLRGVAREARRRAQSGRTVGLAEFFRSFHPGLRKIALLARHGMPAIDPERTP